MADLTTLLSYFLDDLYAGTLGATSTITSIRLAAGTAAAPSVAIGQANLGLYRSGADTLGIAPDGNLRFQFGSAGFSVGDTMTIVLGTIGSPDVVLSRPAANRLQLATGDVFNLAPTAFASLPTGSEGDVAFVTDSSTATPGATVAGGGANNILAFFNGANWICA